METGHDAQEIRQPAVAGYFYPRQPGELRAELECAFLSPLGPGAVPRVPEQGARRVFGIVVPHAGYPYSAQCAAWAYAEMARDGRPDAVVILGLTHRGLGAPLALSPAAGWQTPLGILPVDAALGARLRAVDNAVTPDARAHALEHSVEVQLPLLQFLFGEVPIVPISIGMATTHAVLRLGEALAALAREHDLLIIASTDFSHYVPHDVAERLDQLALAAITAVDPERLITEVREHAISMCGVLPVTAMLAAARASGVREGTLLHHHTSGDVAGDRQAVVGYGAVALYR